MPTRQTTINHDLLIVYQIETPEAYVVVSTEAMICGPREEEWSGF